jgi:hypothetical protein
MLFNKKNKTNKVNINEKNNSKNKKAQFANEFLICVGLSIFIMIIFIAIISGEFKNLTNKKDFHFIRDFGLSLQRELIIANEVNDGYIRKINIPQNIKNFNYEINKIDNVIIITSTFSNKQHIFFVPYYNGSFKKGINIIKKENGVIYVN